MEDLLKKILAELKELNRQVAATSQAGQKQVNAADDLMKNLLGALPTSLMKGANDVG